MKRTLITLALVAATSAQANDLLAPITNVGNTATWTPLDGTIRTYINSVKTRQWDMLFQYEGKHGSNRVRYGVTGCNSTSGLMAEVDFSGKPKYTPSEWAASGEQVFDGIARRICAIAAETPEWSNIERERL